MWCILPLTSYATATWVSGATCGNEGGTAPPPCKIPRWPATYQMNGPISKNLSRINPCSNSPHALFEPSLSTHSPQSAFYSASTIIMPCNYTGYQVPKTVANWGIVDFDWSNNLAGWSSSTPMNNDERQLVQVKMIKNDPSTADYTRVWIYRNSVYGYPWFTSVRKILDDPDYAPWFIMFAGTGPWTSPNCDNNYHPPKCTKYFHTQMDTPTPTATFGPEGHPIGGYGKCYPKDSKSGCDCGTKPCGFYVFNHSSTAVINGQTFREWFLDSYMFNEVGGSELVDGFYWDDTWYPGGVGDDPYKNMVQDMGLSKADLLQLTASYDATMTALINRTLASNKFAWQLMGGAHVRSTVAAECMADLAAYCDPDAQVQKEAMYYPLSHGQSRPKHPFTNCSVFGCTCKGAADYYGIAHARFGCADKGAQQWWIHEAKPCASAYSCCTVDDYSKKPPPYPGCSPSASFEQDLANFLLIRGPYAWLGHGWQGCDQPSADEGGGYPFPPQLHTDFGTPLGLCAETKDGSGVFRREWSKATVEMDCNTGTPSIVMK